MISTGQGGKAVIAAFLKRTPAELRNDQTDGWTLYLHQNPIAWHLGSGYRLTLAGHNTRTTRGRLNSLLEQLGSEYRISQRAGTAYVEGKGERAPLGEHDVLMLDKGMRPAIKGKHRGIWERV